MWKALGILSMCLMLTGEASFGRSEEGKPPELLPVSVGEKAGFINRQGKMVIRPRFDMASHFHEGLAAVSIKEIWGYIDETGSGYIDREGKFIWKSK